MSKNIININIGSSITTLSVPSSVTYIDYKYASPTLLRIWFV